MLNMWTSIKSAFISYVIPWVMKSENQKLIADLAQKAYGQIKK
jgi:hypothetical protein